MAGGFILKSLTFDPGLIYQIGDNAADYAMPRTGEAIAARARRRIVRRARASRPGESPSDWNAKLRKGIVYSYQTGNTMLGVDHTVTVGPELIRGVKGNDVPSILEHGGKADIVQKDGTLKRVKIDARPYLGPAMEEACATGFEAPDGWEAIPLNLTPPRATSMLMKIR